MRIKSVPTTNCGHFCFRTVSTINSGTTRERSTGSKKERKASAAARFTIYKVNKASRKKREKSSAKKERKATKTLAIVLGKSARYIIPYLHLCLEVEITHFAWSVRFLFARCKHHPDAPVFLASLLFRNVCRVAECKWQTCIFLVSAMYLLTATIVSASARVVE